MNKISVFLFSQVIVRISKTEFDDMASRVVADNTSAPLQKLMLMVEPEIYLWGASVRLLKKPGKEKEQGHEPATALEAGQKRPNQNRANQPRKENRNKTTKPTDETPTTPENQKCSGIMGEMK
ncbi:hypothetical protein Q3G72_006167 [Acer saccharum]|nr:hypothetical protein Q3G72_006167 [Acer saccharum]